MKDTGITYEAVASREDAKDYLFSTQVIETTRGYYIEKGLTARQTMEVMGLSKYYEDNVAYFGRAFSYHLPKEGKGRGGARKNSGRPAGSSMCPGCNKLRTECICQDPLKDPDPYTLLQVVTEPVGVGSYSAIVAIESSPGYYKAYEKEIDRWPTWEDIRRTMYGGTKLSPQRAKTYFDHLEREWEG